MAKITNKIIPKNPNYKFICENCNYYSNNKKDYNKHLLTQKHITKQMGEIPECKINFICNCGKNYKHQSSLCKHKKTCNFKKENISCELIDNENVDYKELVITLLKENSDFKEIIKKQQDQISELIPKIGNTINNNNNNNFNINLFLNEHCKDAITLEQFVKNIRINLNNLLTTKNKGLAIGINEIINENMNKLSVYERPIHCTDKKRETLYVKHDKWKKDVDKSYTNNMLKALQLQQIKNLHLWKQAHPNHEKDEDLKHEYMILVNKCTKPLSESEKKLFKNLCDNNYIKDEELLIK